MIHYIYPCMAELTSEDIRKPALWNREPVENVRALVAVASGKGGVGKSATAVNLVLALAAQGRRVGLLDADIYGPSVPRMMGLMKAGQPGLRDNKMAPHVAGGVQCMSVGFVIGESAAILRGPMITKTLRQLLRFTAWGAKDAPLDVLLVDMPPGTGDVHLSLAQQAPLSGAVIVTTPQEVAVMDARKCLQMFIKVGVPIVGVIENMSGGVFGKGGGRKLAEEFNVPFLGEIPLDEAICKAGEAGAAKLPEGPAGECYKQIAAKVLSR